MKRMWILAALVIGLLGGCAAAEDNKDTIGTDTTTDVQNEGDQLGGQDGSGDVACTPTCDEAWECGDDGCGGVCGECGVGDQWACTEHLCVCTPNCGEKECGDDGCGGSCGECAEGKTCGEGVCYDDCTEPAWSENVLRINKLLINLEATETTAIDVDNDPDTCAPEPCDNGLNNSLGSLVGEIDPLVGQMTKQKYESVNEALTALVEDGTLSLLAEIVDFVAEGTEFTMNMYIGAPKETKDVCDFQTAGCEYLVNPISFDVATCTPLIAFNNANVDAGFLTAGGPDAIFILSIDIAALGMPIEAVVQMAQIQADVTVDAGKITALDNGLVAGVVSKAMLLDTVNNLPVDDLLAGLDPEIASLINKETILMIIDGSVVPDVDLDDDGELDAASIAISMAAVSGTIAGFTVPEETPAE